MRVSGAIQRKLKKYKKLMAGALKCYFLIFARSPYYDDVRLCVCVCVCVCAGGYINISYAMMLPLFLSTLDLVSDILFIWRLSNSMWRIGATFLNAAMFVLGSSIFGNFVAFFGIFIYSYKKGKVSFHG